MKKKKLTKGLCKYFVNESFQKRFVLTPLFPPPKKKKNLSMANSIIMFKIPNLFPVSQHFLTLMFPSELLVCIVSEIENFFHVSI